MIFWRTDSNYSTITWARWLTLTILTTLEVEVRRSVVQSQPGQIAHKTLSRKNHHKKVLVEWLKVKALSSNLSTATNK
jgi:hypothetical protein